MSLAPPPLQAWSEMPAVWRRWFQALFLRIGGSTVDLLAPMASPLFTGDPRAPTPAVDDNDTSVATTAFVIGQASTDTPIMDGAATAGASLRYARSDHRHPIDTSRAPISSPTFTGIPSAPTADPGTNTTQIATTAFVGEAVTTGLAAPAWTAPTLLNSWVNVGTGYSSAGYYRDAAGTVHLQGAIRSGTLGATVFTLPAGFRPLGTQAYAVPTGLAMAAYGAVEVTSGGAISVTVGSNVFVHLAGISFRAEQ